MSSKYPILDNRPIDQWKVTELKEELKRRKLTTRGLKEDLIKRLDEAICSEIEKASLTYDNTFDPAPPTTVMNEQGSTGGCAPEKANINLSDNTIEKPHERMEPQVTYEQERTVAFVSKADQDTVDHGEQTSEKLDDDMVKIDLNDSSTFADEGKDEELHVLQGVDSGELGMKQVSQVPTEERTEIVSENVETVMALCGQDLQNSETRNDTDDLKPQQENDDSKSLLPDANDDSKSLLPDAKVNTSEPHNQVSEVSPILGFQVKSDSISTESVSINEKNELKDNIIADDVKLELDVKPAMVQPSPRNLVPDGGESHPMDVEEPQANKLSVGEAEGGTAGNVDIVKKNDTGDLGPSEKLNLEQSSGDGFADDDVTEIKQIDSKSTSDEIEVIAEKGDVRNVKEEGLVDIVGEDMPAATNMSKVEEKNGPAATSVKRKLHDQQAAANNDTAKRQRRWNMDGLKVSEPRSSDVPAATPKDTFQPAFKRSFSRSDSTVSEEAQKERVVPPSSKPPTNSLRIDRFLRPFTLKAVQELLGKTGDVTDFWMDHIKTHCYVSYSSVEEAVETRNAVYNLQWPPNGGRPLVADFVDPQEVKVRVEAPPQSPAISVSSGANTAPAPQPVQPQPSPRQQVQKVQLGPPALPPPQLSDPPSAREHLVPVRERLSLPPPPPLPEKVDPPIVTLDDLFRKTKATPRVYYLPLSEEQVAAKLRMQGKTVKQ